MTGVAGYDIFLGTMLILTISPGIDSLFVINTAIGYGRRPALAATAGITLGNVFHTLLASFGLSLLVAQVPALFNIVKFAGATYMLWLGVGSFLPARGNPGDSGPDDTQANGYFLKGLFTNLLNVKIPLFFMAVFPPFVAPGDETSPVPYLILGTTMLAMGGAWFVVISFCAAWLRRKMAGNDRLMSVVRAVTGLLFLLLAAGIIFVTI